MGTVLIIAGRFALLWDITRDVSPRWVFFLFPSKCHHKNVKQNEGISKRCGWLHSELHVSDEDKL